MSYEIRYLTIKEATAKLRLPRKVIIDWINSGILTALKTPHGGKLNVWRIVDPSPKLAEMANAMTDKLSYSPLLTAAEVAEVLGITAAGVRYLVMTKSLESDLQGGVRYFSISMLRRYLNKIARSKLHRRKSRVNYSAVAVRFAMRQLRNDMPIDPKDGDDEFGRLLNQILAYSEPRKSLSLRELYARLDDAGVMMKAVKVQDSH